MTGEKEPSKCFLGDERDEWKFYFITGASEKRNFLIPIILKIPDIFSKHSSRLTREKDGKEFSILFHLCIEKC